jgi:hypothetical protein
VDEDGEMYVGHAGRCRLMKVQESSAFRATV